MFPLTAPPPKLSTFNLTIRTDENIVARIRLRFSRLSRFDPEEPRIASMGFVPHECLAKSNPFFTRSFSMPRQRYLFAFLFVIVVSVSTHALGFGPPVNYPVGPCPLSVGAGDFNGDGYLDLAVVNNNNGGISSVSVLLNNGDGTFQSAVNY